MKTRVRVPLGLPDVFLLETPLVQRCFDSKYGVAYATQLLLAVFYREHNKSPQLTTRQRNEQLRARVANGERISDLAREYGISPQRVDQIVHFRSK